MCHLTRVNLSQTDKYLFIKSTTFFERSLLEVLEGHMLLSRPRQLKEKTLVAIWIIKNAHKIKKNCSVAK